MLKMKSLFSIVLVLGLVFTGAMVVSYSVQAEVIIQFAHSNSPNPYQAIEHMWAVPFKNIVESESNGEIQVDIYPSAQLGGQREIAESVQTGIIEMGSASDAVISGFDKNALMFSTPYLFDSIDGSYRLWKETEWGQNWSESFKNKTGLRLLSVVGYGFRHLTNSAREIRSPEDAKGLSFRVMESPVPMAMIEGLGAKPQPIPMDEVYSALDQGVVDGQENPFTSITSYALYEVQPYITLSGHQLGTQMFFISEKLFNSLSDRHKEIIISASEEATMAALGVSTLHNRGVGVEEAATESKIYSPTEKEMAAFKEAMQPLALEELYNELGRDVVDEVIDAVNSMK